MMTRDEAAAILADREGTPPEHIDACPTDALVNAVLAGEGQPCAACHGLVIWTDEAGWTHQRPDTTCFLA